MTTPAPKKRLQILCVDDDQNVLEGLTLHLRRGYEVLTATGGASGLEALGKNPACAVVLSDMNMPGMDGATFLSRARQLTPDAVRILLTGQADLSSAIAAVNDGQIFRFLTKPCPPPTLVQAVDAAAEQHRLITAERVLLEQTLHGSVTALTEILALTSPVSFGRTTRIKQLVVEVANKLDLRERWPVEIAAMVSQLGSITLPPETVEKVYYAQSLTEAEQKMVARTSAVTEQLLSHIPRLEPVREVLALCRAPYKPVPPTDRKRWLLSRWAQVLAVAIDLDALEGQGNATSLALDTMRGRAGRYDPEVLNALADLRGATSAQENVRELPLSALQPGMVFVEDVKMMSGTLLVTRGFEVSAGFLARVRNFSPGTVREPVRVFLRDAHARPERV